MTDRRTEIERGHLARQILDNPLWAETWSVWEQSMHRAWANAPARDAEGREALFLALNAGLKAKKQIEAVFTTGEMAAQQEKAEHARKSERKTRRTV